MLPCAVLPQSLTPRELFFFVSAPCTQEAPDKGSLPSTSCRKVRGPPLRGVLGPLPLRGVLGPLFFDKRRDSIVCNDGPYKTKMARVYEWVIWLAARKCKGKSNGRASCVSEVTPRKYMPPTGVKISDACNGRLSANGRPAEQRK